MIFYSDFYPFAKFRIESLSSEMKYKYFPSQLLWGRIKDVICRVFLRNRAATLECHASNKDFVDICLFLNHSWNILRNIITKGIYTKIRRQNLEIIRFKVYHIRLQIRIRSLNEHICRSNGFNSQSDICGTIYIGLSGLIYWSQFIQYLILNLKRTHF